MDKKIILSTLYQRRMMFTHARCILLIACLTSSKAVAMATQTGHQLHIKIHQLVPSKAELEAALKKHYQQLEIILVQESKEAIQSNLLDYLPAFTYNLVQSVVHISYTLHKLTNTFKKQKTQKAKSKAMRQKLHLDLQKDLDKLHRHYADLEAAISLYNQAVNVYLLKKKLFQLVKADYQNLDLTPKEFIQSQIKIKKEKLKLQEQQTHLIQLKNRLIEMAHLHHHHEKVP